jgi:hypothetical protein
MFACNYLRMIDPTRSVIETPRSAGAVSFGWPMLNFICSQ